MRQRLRGTSGKYLGRPSLCDKEPGRETCLRQLNGAKPDVCRNCQSPKVQTEKIKVFSK